VKVLVVGGSGLLGTDLVSKLSADGYEVHSPRHAELDITDPTSVAQIASKVGAYDWCINCAAYTAVDKAETEVEAATVLNTLAPSYLGGACLVAGIKVIHISTDFVFDGSGTEPYGEDFPRSPLGVYGRTKADGEIGLLEVNQNALIVRTSWLYGPNGNSFPKTMIRAWDAGKNLRVIADQTGCPTYTKDLASVLSQMIAKNAHPGIYHGSGSTVSNWHSFAVKAITAWKEFKGDPREVVVAPIPTSEYPTPARRPQYSVLSTQRLQDMGIEPMPSVEIGLEDFVRNLEF